MSPKLGVRFVQAPVVVRRNNPGNWQRDQRFEFFKLPGIVRNGEAIRASRSPTGIARQVLYTVAAPKKSPCCTRACTSVADGDHQIHCRRPQVCVATRPSSEARHGNRRLRRRTTLTAVVQQNREVLAQSRLRSFHMSNSIVMSKR
jgi:hypothetical protein